jgi:hypothetical protein
MNVIYKESFIHQKADENYRSTKAGKIYWSRHATSELVNDSLHRTEVETGLEKLRQSPQFSRRPSQNSILLR